MPKPIWIRPDKSEHAKSKEEETWFYMVYLNEILVLTKETVEQYEDNVVTVHIKKNKHGRRVPQRYIEIPYHESSHEEEMFDWIEEQIT